MGAPRGVRRVCAGKSFPLSGSLSLRPTSLSPLLSLLSLFCLSSPPLSCTFPSPGFVSPGPTLGTSPVSPGAHGDQRPRAGPARRQGGEGGKAGPEAVAGGRAWSRETGAPGHPRGLGGRRRGEVCVRFHRTPAGGGRQSARALPSPVQTRERPTARGCPWGGHQRRGGGAGSGGRRHLGPGQQRAPHRPAAVPMRAPTTALGSHALRCSAPGPAPAPCPGTAPHGPRVPDPLLLQR